MPSRDPEPTDPEVEKSKGRLALWLDPADLEYLAHHCCCPEDADQATRERCGRLRFRAHAALLAKPATEHEADPRSTQAGTRHRPGGFKLPFTPSE